MKRTVSYTHLDVYKRQPSAITSCSDVVLYPPGCDKLDYEIELAVVIKEVDVYKRQGPIHGPPS